MYVHDSSANTAVYILRRSKIRGNQANDTKMNAAHGIGSPPILLTENEAYMTVHHRPGSCEDDREHVIYQVIYDLPDTTTMTNIATEPNEAYGGIEQPGNENRE